MKDWSLTQRLQFCDPDGDCLYDHLRYIEPTYIDAAVGFIAGSLRGLSIDQ